MTFDHMTYLSCLRWKTGEYQAIKVLSDDTKKALIPLIEIPQIGWDFEQGKESKIIDDHLTTFTKRVHDKWGKALCFIDIKHISSDKRMNDGSHPINFVFNSLSELECLAIPVTGLDKDEEYQKQIKNILKEKKIGLCLRITLDQAARSKIKNKIDFLLSELDTKPNNCNLILDIVSPNFVPLDGFLKLLQRIIESFPYLDKWTSFTILGTSFPETLSKVGKGINILPRYEWQLYRNLVFLLNENKLRLPSFGDYAILNPSARDDLDWRIISSSANIRYTIDDNWCIVRGPIYKERKKVLEKYTELSDTLVKSQHYYRPEFSWGDKYIKNCADKRVGHSNHTKWRQIGTNHHIEKVIIDIANFYASSMSS